MPKTLEIGLSSRPLSEDEAESLVLEAEELIRRRLVEKLGRRLEELDIVVTAELSEGGRRLTLSIDVRAAGRPVAPMSYDELVAEAIDEAVRRLAERLESRRGKGGSRGAEGAG